MLNESFLIKFDDDVDSRHCLAGLCSLVRVVSSGISPDTRPYLIKGQSRFLKKYRYAIGIDRCNFRLSTDN